MIMEEVKDTEFPTVRTRRMVRCTYPNPVMKVRLMDPGSCAIPINRTITKEQWSAQQNDSDK